MGTSEMRSCSRKVCTRLILKMKITTRQTWFVAEEFTEMMVEQIRRIYQNRILI